MAPTPSSRPSAPRAAGRRPGDAPRTGKRINQLAIWALVLAVIPFTFFVGLFLGYRSLGQLTKNREYGQPFAQAAIWIGWIYTGVLIFGLLVYLWLRNFA